MNNVYFSKTQNFYRSRITVNGEKQKHLATSHDKIVACAVVDLFVRLQGLEDTHLLNFPKMNLREVYELLEKRDAKALKQVMDKATYRLVKNDGQKASSQS